MLPEYSHTNSESLSQISTPMAEIQNFFYGIVFLLAHPVYDRLCMVLQLSKSKVKGSFTPDALSCVAVRLRAVPQGDARQRNAPHPADVTFPPPSQPIKAYTRFRDPRRMQG